MIKQYSILALLMVLPLAFTTPVLAVDEINVSKGMTVAGAPLAVHGYDVVAYFTKGAPTVGSHKFATAYKGGTYQFASKGNLDTFKANPAKYIPAYGGFCAYGVSLGKKFNGDPKLWKIVNGKLYLNLNTDVQKVWDKDVAGYIKTAESKWEKIQQIAVGKL